MWEDPIVNEVRQVREAHAAHANYELEAIFRDIKRQEEASGRTFVTFAPRLVRRISEKRPAEREVGSHQDVTTHP